MKKRALAILLTIATGMTVFGCAPKTPASSPAPQTVEATTAAAAQAETAPAETAVQPAKESENVVTILYTNDTHTYINNQVKDADGNPHPGLNFEKVAQMKYDLLEAGENVLLVDAGDHEQGTAYGALDEGKSIVDIMNAAGYDLAVLGNHEFSYGLFRAFSNMARARFPYICCNFYEANTGDIFLEPAYFAKCGDQWVAFVGITTPETVYSTTPIYFQNENGEFIYKFYGNENAQDLYDIVQETIDALREGGVDYVIGLGHMGVDPASPIKSTDVIANTRGFDAFIDGHSHTIMEKKMVKDADGKEVLLTQTGCYFSAVGKMTIARDGTIDTELITEYEGVDDFTATYEQNLIRKVNEELGQKVAETSVNLWINNPENTKERLVRRMETNLGDLCADAIYWYFNEHDKLGCDVAIINGGGVRADLPAGDLTYESCKTVQPFGNVLCLVKTTGQDILDALEWTTKDIGKMDAEGKPAERGSFTHVAGLSYTIDTTIESTAVGDSNGVFVSPPTGEYRVKDVKIYNRETCRYEPLDPEKTYTLGGTNYSLRNGGEGLSMFLHTEPVKDYVGEDYMIMAEYLRSFAPNADGIPTVNTANSPLHAYENYLLDYDNPLGAGRILQIVQ